MQLFAHGDLNNYLEQRRRQIISRIEAIPRDQFLVSSDQQILDHVLPEGEIDPITLFDDRMEMEHGEGLVDVEDYGRLIKTHAVFIVISIPYTGTYPLWTMRPNRWQDFPEGDVEAVNSSGYGTLKLSFSAPLKENPENIKQAIDRRLSVIRFFLVAQREQIEMDNRNIASVALNAIQQRRIRLEEQEGIVRHLNIPLKPRKGSLEFQPAAIKRILQKPLPPAPEGGFKPEPGIREEDYEHILSVIRHAGRSFEAAPTTFSVHNEEELRNIILANLNGHYEGEATGETFRRKGKTDIRIEVRDRAAFVAECKVWRGQKEVQEACDQLLGYLTWRDGKTALIIFNRDVKEFSQLLTKVPGAVRAHPEMSKELPQEQKGEWRFVLSSRDDPQRLITVHVFVFDIAP